MNSTTKLLIIQARTATRRARLPYRIGMLLAADSEYKMAKAMISLARDYKRSTY